MHFRARANVIQCIRTNYDATTKKPKVEIVGRIAKSKPVITDELSKLFKPEELAELEAYLKNQNQVSQLQMELATRSLVTNIELAMQWLSLVDISTENEVLALDILRTAQKLRQEIIKKFVGVAQEATKTKKAK